MRDNTVPNRCDLTLPLYTKREVKLGVDWRKNLVFTGDKYPARPGLLTDRVAVALVTKKHDDKIDLMFHRISMFRKEAFRIQQEVRKDATGLAILEAHPYFYIMEEESAKQIAEFSAEKFLEGRRNNG